MEDLELGTEKEIYNLLKCLEAAYSYKILGYLMELGLLTVEDIDLHGIVTEMKLDSDENFTIVVRAKYEGFPYTWETVCPSSNVVRNFRRLIDTDYSDESQIGKMAKKDALRIAEYVIAVKVISPVDLEDVPTYLSHEYTLVKKLAEYRLEKGI